MRTGAFDPPTQRATSMSIRLLLLSRVLRTVDTSCSMLPSLIQKIDNTLLRVFVLSSLAWLTAGMLIMINLTTAWFSESVSSRPILASATSGFIVAT